MNTKVSVIAVGLVTMATAGCSTFNPAEEEALNTAVGIRIRSVGDGVEITLPDTALFDSGKANLNQSAAAVIATQGMAFDKPSAGNETAEGRARNRRTEITLVGENIETLMGPSH